MRATEDKTNPPAITGGPLARVGFAGKQTSDANREESCPVTLVVQLCLKKAVTRR